MRPKRFRHGRNFQMPSSARRSPEQPRSAAQISRALAVLAALVAAILFPLDHANAQERPGEEDPPVIIEYDPNAASGVLPPRRSVPHESPPAIDSSLQNRIQRLAERVALKQTERQAIPKDYDVPAALPGEPPRPGTKEFEEFLREREALR